MNSGGTDCIGGGCVTPIKFSDPAIPAIVIKEQSAAYLRFLFHEDLHWNITKDSHKPTIEHLIC
jgi:hypothetical protein